MATLQQVHDAVSGQLEMIDGLRCFPHPPQGVTPPVAFVALDTTEPTSMGRQSWEFYRLSVFVFTAQSVRPQDGYRALLEYADPEGAKSVPLTIWDGNDRSAGSYGAATNTQIHVEGFAVLGVDQIDAYEMYGGVFTLGVHSRGS